MKRQLIIWLCVVAVVVIVLFVFNFQGGEDVIPLSEIFQDAGEGKQRDVEYIFVDDKSQGQQKAKEDVSLNFALQQAASAKKKEDSSSTKAPRGKFEDNVDFSSVPFTIQVASYREKQTAERALEKMRKKGYEVYLVAKDLEEKGIWHRIYIGRFATRSSAEDFRGKLKEEFVNCFVIAVKK